tara:strand:+ start:114 stop:2000 length:1887 start_codon:yes stop_codon:yes gene_type:complete
MAYNKFQMLPGINREGTAFSAQGGWFDGNLVRFRKGYPEKIGGWIKEQVATYLGTGRALHAWVSLATTKYLSVGTTVKYYVKEGDNFYDITPIRATTSAGDVTFSASNGSSTVTVADTSHGASKGDYVTYSGAASLGGLVIAAALNQEYSIDSIVNANSYKIIAKDTDGDTITANSSDSGNGGSSVVGAYQISVGLDNYVSGSGWSAGPWGDGTYGSASGLAFNNQLRIWTHDNFGEDLIINPRAGGIFYWTENNGTSVRAKSLDDLGATLPPTLALQTLVSDIDRHVICLGADPLDDAGVARTSAIDPMFICWCDQENINQWEPTYTNTAGSLRLSAGTQIVGGLRSRQEILIWTDDALYNMRFIGPPYTFGVNLINQGIGLISPKGAINAPPGVFWMDRSGFYSYTGTVSRVPCSVHEYVFTDFNQEQSFKVFAFLNRQFNEVGWFYPSGDSLEIDRYVTYNYQEKVWSYGLLTRYAWLDEGVQPYPRATGVDTNNYVYKHETGNDADGSPMDNVYIESGDFALDGIGNAYTQIQNAIPDVRFLGDGGSDQVVNFVLKTRNFPNETLTTKSTSQVTASTTKLDLRGRARQAVVRLESDDDATTNERLGVGWRLGDMRLNTRSDGRR